MTVVDEALIERACAALGVKDVTGIHVSRRGKKFVRLVQTDGHDQVMKVLATTSAYPWRLTDIQREVDLMAAIDNPHIVKVESGLAVIGSPVHGAAWLEEYAAGRDLSWYMRWPWDWANTARMGRQIALGLTPLHAAGAVHCDLSPDNIRVLPGLHYKVMDLGLTRHVRLDRAPVKSHWGTWGFMSPEHVKLYSGAVTSASDVFCVGALMYMALTGGDVPIPYTGVEVDYSARLDRAEIVDIGIERPDLNEDQLGIIRRCLHPQPARRYLDAQALADVLAGFD